MEGELTEEENHPFLDFQGFTDALETEVNFNVSTQLPLTLPPLPQRISNKHSRSNQNANARSKNQTTEITPSSSQEYELSNDLLLTNNPITSTNSAPVVSLYNNTKKRNRSTSSSSTNAMNKPANKKSGAITNIPTNNFRVSFAPQVNQGSDSNLVASSSNSKSTSTTIMGPTASTSTSNARAFARDQHDMATGPNDKPERVIVNTLAKPMWDVTRQHLINQQKSHLRAIHLENLLKEDIIPVEFYGAEPLKRYYAHKAERSVRICKPF